MSIAGKNILLISNQGYSKQIKEEMQSLGAKVIVFNDKPNDRFLEKVLGRIKFQPYIKNVLEKYYSDEIKGISNKNVDYVLSIRGEYTPTGALQKMRDTFPNAKLILYMWDSIENNKGIEKKWSFYDEIWTFDRKDYLEHQDVLKFRPLFYCEKVLPHEVGEKDKRYDLAFIGTGHGDRISIIKEIEKQCKHNNIDFYYYIYVPHILVYFYNKIFNRYYKNVKMSDVHFDILPLDEVYRIYNNSNCILDVESLTQTGLTMRTIEIVGLKKKLMTTNKDIENYDFYSSGNFEIFNRNDVKISKDFFEKKYVELQGDLYKKYSLKSWVLEVLSEQE
jgi:hypothetical protein